MTFASFKKAERFSALPRKEVEIRDNTVQVIRNGYRGLGMQEGSKKPSGSMLRAPPLIMPMPLKPFNPMPKITPIYSVARI